MVRCVRVSIGARSGCCACHVASQRSHTKRSRNLQTPGPAPSNPFHFLDTRLSLKEIRTDFWDFSLEPAGTMADQLRRRRADAAGTNGAQLPFAGLDDEKKDKLSTEKSTSEVCLGAWNSRMGLCRMEKQQRVSRSGPVCSSQQLCWPKSRRGPFQSR